MKDPEVIFGIICLIGMVVLAILALTTKNPIWAQIINSL